MGSPPLHEPAETQYANTDFDLKSATPFDRLHRELDQSCCVLHYGQENDGDWFACIESNRAEPDGSAAVDIRRIVQALESLSSEARTELAACHVREFNIGFECGDTWAYVHQVPLDVVRLVADASCSIAVTLYPLRNPDGSLKT